MDINTKFGYWVTIAPFSNFKLEKYSRPLFVGKKETPSNLNNLTIGQLIELSKVGSTIESLYKVIEIVLGMSRKDIEKARAVDAVRFVGWVVGEVEKINSLFRKAEIKPTQQERQAGIDTLKFGLFGMLDWYALRMSITDHDVVLKTPWLRIYKCMDMDNKKRVYDIRLQKIQAAEMKRKH